MRPALALLPLVPLLGGCIPRLVPHVEASVAAFAPVFAGDASQGAGNPPLELDRELGLDDRELVPAVGAAVEWVGLRVEASGFRSRIDGDDTLAAAFGGLPAGTAVDTEGKFTVVRGAVLISGIDAGIVKIRPGLGVDVVYLDLEAKSGVLGATEKLEAQGAVPLLVLNGEVDLGPLRGLVDVSGIRGDYRDVTGTFLDGEATLRLKVGGPAELFAGYRYLRLELEGTSNGAAFDSNFRFHGPLAGIAVRF
ncbi:MAG TPA: hypothetical protein VFI25_16795 [Planctomycetota bacterium]|jgi:hypothetical protein|nr:hypothetical protein [Planctomycetota bacterium]